MRNAKALCPTAPKSAAKRRGVRLRGQLCRWQVGILHDNAREAHRLTEAAVEELLGHDNVRQDVRGPFKDVRPAIQETAPSHQLTTYLEHLDQA